MSPKAQHTPGPWPRGFSWQGNPPRLPVEMRTARDEDGIDYAVEVAEENPCAFEEGENRRTVWSRRVDFGQRDETVAGGAAFAYAAREQQRIADQWVAALACAALAKAVKP